MNSKQPAEIMITLSRNNITEYTKFIVNGVESEVTVDDNVCQVCSIKTLECGVIDNGNIKPRVVMEMEPADELKITYKGETENGYQD